MPFKILYIALVAIGAFISLDTIFISADIVNGLMAIPNLIAIIALRKVIVDETNKFLCEID